MKTSCLYDIAILCFDQLSNNYIIINLWLIKKSINDWNQIFYACPMFNRSNHKSQILGIVIVERPSIQILIVIYILFTQTFFFITLQFVIIWKNCEIKIFTALWQLFTMRIREKQHVLHKSIFNPTDCRFLCRKIGIFFTSKTQFDICNIFRNDKKKYEKNQSTVAVCRIVNFSC